MAHFVLSDFLNLSLQQSAETSSPLLGLNMAPAESLMMDNPSQPTARPAHRRDSVVTDASDAETTANAAGSAEQAPPEQGIKLAWPVVSSCPVLSFPSSSCILCTYKRAFGTYGPLRFMFSLEVHCRYVLCIVYSACTKQVHVFHSACITCPVLSCSTPPCFALPCPFRHCLGLPCPVLSPVPVPVLPWLHGEAWQWAAGNLRARQNASRAACSVLMLGTASKHTEGLPACCDAEAEEGAAAHQSSRQQEVGVPIPGMGAHGGHATAMTSPFSNWDGEADAESQVNQARLKALGKRRKSYKKIALEVVEEVDKEGEEGVQALYHIKAVVWQQLMPPDI